MLTIFFFLRLWCVGLVMAFLLTPTAVQAGGIALGATRIVYPADVRETSLAVTNSDKKNRFLIQTWIEDNKGARTSDFIITPPLFVSKPGGETKLRIMYAGSRLPRDRETVYWLNSKAIPAIERDAIRDKNVLQIAILSRIKLFVRPAGLDMSPAEAPAKLTFRRQGNTLTIENPSPYYITLVNLNAGSQKLPNTMVAPKNRTSLTLPATSAGDITYQTVNDFGANTPRTTASLN